MEYKRLPDNWLMTFDQEIDNEMTVTWTYQFSRVTSPIVAHNDLYFDSVTVEEIPNALDDPTIRWEYQKWVWGAPMRLAKRIVSYMQAPPLAL